MCQFSEKAQKFFDYFYHLSDGDNVCLRIRGTIEKPEVKVYYKGIKLLDFYNDLILLNVSLFLPNNTNAEDLKQLAYENKIDEIVPYANVLTDYETLQSIGFQFMYENSYLDLPFSKGNKSNDKLEIKAEQIVNNLKNIIEAKDLKIYQGPRTGKEMGYRAQIEPLESLDLTTAFRLKLFGYTQTGNVKLPDGSSSIRTGFQSLKVNFKFIESTFDYSDVSFKKLMDIMKKRASIYGDPVSEAKEPKVDFSPTRLDSEKGFQQTLVSKMSTLNGRKAMSFLFHENDIPFEMEYTFYASNKDGKKDTEKEIDEENNMDETEAFNKRGQDNKKGRIDNVFVDFEHQMVRFVELKIDDGVIGGTNGIHKHLLDMANCIQKNTNFKDEFSEIVNRRYEILNAYGVKEEYGIPTNSHPKLENDFTFCYDIICGYSTLDNKEKVYERFNSIKDLNILDRKVVEAVSEENRKFIRPKEFIESLQCDGVGNQANQYIQELLKFNIKDYEQYLDEMCHCPVHIYVTDSDYSKFELMD